MLVLRYNRTLICFCSALIVIYQRMVLPVMNLGHDPEPWYHAIQRCLDGCSDIAESIRILDRESLENASPLFTHCIFVAARFLLGNEVVLCFMWRCMTKDGPAEFLCTVHSKTLAVNIPRCLDLLIYRLNICAQRWHFASTLIPPSFFPLSMTSSSLIC